MRMVIPIIVIIASYLWLDRPIALLMQDLPSYLQPVMKFSSFCIAPGVHLVLWSSLFLASFWVDFFRKHRIFIFQCLLLLVLIYCATGFSKLMCSRARPDLFLHQDLYGFLCNQYSNEFRSFPSSHTSFAIGLGYFLYRQTKRVIWVYLAGLLSLSRIFLNEHFVSDLLGGAILGLLVALGLTLLLENGQVQDLPEDR